MALNFDRKYRRDRGGRATGPFSDLRRRLYRAPDGKVLGVFKGIADSLGYSCCATRWIGFFVLITLAGAAGANGFKVMVLVSGFFYLLLALLMQPPREAGGAVDHPGGPTSAGRGIPSSSSVPRYTPITRPRVDLGQLDRQLDGLNRRIQQMEAIVTDREYDWNRRMDT